MVQLEVKLRIKHERGNRRRRKRDGVVQAARGERDRKEREEGRVSPCSPIRGQNID